MKFIHSATEHRLLSRTNPEKMPQQQEAPTESRAEFFHRFEQTEKRVQEKLSVMEQQIAALPEGSEERAQREIDHSLRRQEHQVIASRLERLEGQRRDLEQAVSDRLNEWEDMERGSGGAM
ncbi:MAG: hypothetical protein PHU04_05015 [Candidatus Peribacteraceae bacterium]|nr:hypothetical protein [Candidatus Peribacteraceae bacterium]